MQEINFFTTPNKMVRHPNAKIQGDYERGYKEESIDAIKKIVIP